MAKVVDGAEEKNNTAIVESTTPQKPKPLTANEAMRRIDDLT